MEKKQSQLHWDTILYHTHWPRSELVSIFWRPMLLSISSCTFRMTSGFSIINTMAQIVVVDVVSVPAKKRSKREPRSCFSENTDFMYEAHASECGQEIRKKPISKDKNLWACINDRVINLTQSGQIGRESDGSTCKKEISARGTFPRWMFYENVSTEINQSKVQFGACISDRSQKLLLPPAQITWITK